MRDVAKAELAASAHWHRWAEEHLVELLTRAVEAVVLTYQHGGKVLFCGNGGSAADSLHLAAELTGRARYERPPLPAVALTADVSALTAIANDQAFDQVFARQVLALGEPGDVLVALSTSGRSANVLRAVAAAKERGLTVIAFAGRDGGPLAQQADIALTVPALTADRAQEVHLTLGHVLCGLVEAALFPEYANAEQARP